MVQNGHAAAAKRYFDDGLACEDYYTPKAKKDHEHDEPGWWGGRGAERLGLVGAVERESFHRLCENRTPNGSESLTPRTKANRRVGYDINFHCPKSVSVVYAMTGDATILASFKTAVRETMGLLEQDSKARVRAGGAQGERVTGNLVWAEFIHTTARPVDGIPDPHLHAHCFTFNATYDAVESRWKAGEFGSIKASGSFYEAAFHARLAGLLSENGYDVERRGRFWELSSVRDSVVDKFSRRTAEVNRFAEKKGITDPKEKAGLGARTRRSKAEARPWEDIRRDWDTRLNAEERQSVLNAKRSCLDAEPAAWARDAVAHAAAACFDRSATVPELTLIEEALRYGVGRVSLPDVQQELSRLELTRSTEQGGTVLTNSKALEREQRLVSFARAGRGTCPVLCPDAALPGSENFSPGQAAAVSSVLSSRDRVSLLRVGKPSLTSGVRNAVERAGHNLIRLDGGDAIAEPERQQAWQGGVLWVERAEKLTARSMQGLFEAASRHDARIVLVSGLSRSGVRDERALLKLLERDAGVRSAQSHRATRERAEQRTAAKAMNQGDTRSGFSRLDRLGRIRETAEADTASAVGSEYVRSARDGKKTRVVTPDGGERITESIRRMLREAKLLGRPRTFERLTSLRLTPTTRACADCYERGQVVVFYKSVKGFKAGQRYEVMGRDPFGNVLAKHLVHCSSLLPSRVPWMEALPLSKSEHFDVFKRSTIEIARGDSVRVTRTGRTKNERFGPEKLLSKRQQAIRLANYDLFSIKAPDRRYRVPKDSVHRVVGFTLKGDIKLDNGWILPKHFGHLEHGYCVGPNAGGGGKVECLLVVQPSKSSESLGRAWRTAGLESVIVFTDDKDALRRKMHESSDSSVRSGRLTEPERPRTREERERER